MYGMKTHTGLGILAILLWSTNIAFARRLAEMLGVFTSGTLIFLLGGIIATIILMASKHTVSVWKGISPKYIIGCGIFFVVIPALCRLRPVGCQPHPGHHCRHPELLVDRFEFDLFDLGLWQQTPLVPGDRHPSGTFRDVDGIDPGSIHQLGGSASLGANLAGLWVGPHGRCHLGAV